MAKTYPKPETTIESCPYCEREVKILANKRSPCPVCGRLILPCSTCSIFKENVSCSWTSSEGCKRFPKPQRKEQVK